VILTVEWGAFMPRKMAAFWFILNKIFMVFAFLWCLVVVVV